MRRETTGKEEFPIISKVNVPNLQLQLKNNFQRTRHVRLLWINYVIVKGFPYGLPWAPPEDGKQYAPNGRLALCFQVSNEDSLCLEVLLDELQEREL